MGQVELEISSHASVVGGENAARFGYCSKAHVGLDLLHDPPCTGRLRRDFHRYVRAFDYAVGKFELRDARRQEMALILSLQSSDRDGSGGAGWLD
jgi:hypothetical protein